MAALNLIQEIKRPRIRLGKIWMKFLGKEIMRAHSQADRHKVETEVFRPL